MIDVRPMSGRDLERVAVIYEDHTGVLPPESWRGRVDDLLAREGAAVALVATTGERVVGYLVGEVRSWEFGSPPAGWIIGVGVGRDHQGDSVGRLLLQAALARFGAADVTAVRTMVRRDDVGVLRFFRGSGFAAGPYTELELEL